MRATDLAELAAFEAVARHRSFRRASEERGVTASAISHAVSSLEARIGVRLLNRTTRSVSPTDAGQMLLSQLSPALAEIGSAVDALNLYRDTPFGKVRLNAPNSIAPYLLGPVLGSLIRQNPHLELEVVATDRLVDIVDEGFDAGIRLGESLREGMTAVRIGPRLRFAVVGAPSYFRERTVPTSPADLKDHACICNMYPNGTRYPWSFARDDEAVDFHPKGPITLDDHDLMVETALSGIALAYVWADRARVHVEAGRLVSCLADWCPPEDWFYLYYPTRKHQSAGLRAVIEALRV